MKLTKTSWLVIIIGFFVIILAGLSIVRSQQVHQQNQLNEKLALAQSRLEGIKLEQLSDREGELEEQLSQVTSQFKAVKAVLSQPVDSVTVNITLFDIIEAYGLKLTEMSSSSSANGGLEGINFSVISLTAKVEGDVPNLINFTTELNSYFAVGVVKSITITILETASKEKASADIQLVIYTYQGG